MKVRLVMIAFFVLLLAGCGKKTLVDNTSQKRAMQIVVALFRHGLSATAERESGGQGKYRVEISESNYAQALAAIEHEGLLEDPAPSFDELTATSGFFPASREVEALRMDHALASEIKHILEQMPGIDSAQVLVRKRFGSKEETIPSVSLLLRVAQDGAIEEKSIIELAQRSVPGLTPDRVFVTFDRSVLPHVSGGSTGALNLDGKTSYVPLVPFVFNWRVPKDDYTSFALLFIGCMCLFGIVSVCFGYMVGQIRGRKAVSENSDIAPISNRLDRPKRDLLDG